MDVVAWILSILLALAFAAAGAGKVASSREKLLENPKMGWAADFSDTQVTMIGSVEVLGALGLILPWALGIARVLTPIAALGLALVMIGALVVHARRGELKEALPVNATLIILSLVVAALRFAQL